MRRYELGCNWGMSYLSTFASRQERERFTKIIRQWKQDKDPTRIVKEMLFEDLSHLHVFSQRLLDNRMFFDGEETSYTCENKLLKDGGITTEKVGVISTEDKARKQKEFDKYMPQIQKMKVDIAKLLLAKDVSYHVHDTDRSVSDLFSALEKRGAVTGQNGQDKDETQTISR